MFHLYKGVRAGGGIGDEIGSPDGDDYEVYRIVFDFTFFLSVIIILLAIIQGTLVFLLVSPMLFYDTTVEKTINPPADNIIKRIS